MKPVPVPELPYPGTLLIWRCPALSGKTIAPEDTKRLKDAGIGHVVCLLEPEECLQYGEPLPLRRVAVEAAGMRFSSVPIEDFGVPTREQLAALIQQIVDGLRAGERLLVHCMAGLGRAGTVAACVLVQQGMDPEDAITLVRWIRPGAIQSTAQEELIRTIRPVEQ